MSGKKSKAEVEQQQVAGLKMQGTPTTESSSPLHRLRTQTSNPYNTTPLKDMQLQLKKLNENLTNMATKISNIDSNISNIDQQIGEIQADVKTFSSRLTKIEDEHKMLMEQNKRMQTEIETFNQNIANVISDVDILKSKRSTTESTTSTNDLTTEVAFLREALEAQENNNISTDAVLYNIPADQPNLVNIFNHLCLSLDIKAPTLRTIFRTRHNERTNTSPVIIKFFSSYERNHLLVKIAEYRRIHKRQLILRDVGIESENPIYIRECLTKKNQQILHAALNLKKQKLITTVFTSRGIVYIKYQVHGDAVIINNIESLTAEFNDVSEGSAALPVIVEDNADNAELPIQ